jgi:hypothetical protein
VKVNAKKKKSPGLLISIPCLQEVLRLFNDQLKRRRGGNQDLMKQWVKPPFYTKFV